MPPPKLTNALLKRATAAAVKNAEIAALVTQAMRERYGATHSDVDCDWLIDVLDYGRSKDPPTLAQADRAMADCGAHPLKGVSS